MKNTIKLINDFGKLNLPYTKITINKHDAEPQWLEMISNIKPSKNVVIIDSNDEDVSPFEVETFDRMYRGGVWQCDWVEIKRVIPIIIKISKELNNMYSKVQYGGLNANSLTKMISIKGNVYGKERYFINDFNHKNNVKHVRVETTTVSKKNNTKIILFIENGDKLTEEVIFQNRYMPLCATREQFEEMKFNLFTRGIQKDILF